MSRYVYETELPNVLVTDRIQLQYALYELRKKWDSEVRLLVQGFRDTDWESEITSLWYTLIQYAVSSMPVTEPIRNIVLFRDTKEKVVNGDEYDELILSGGTHTDGRIKYPGVFLARQVDIYGSLSQQEVILAHPQKLMLFIGDKTHGGDQRMEEIKKNLNSLVVG